MLIVRNLSKTFRIPNGVLTVLRDVNLSLERGESVALTGESGSGKSTLLHLIAGLDQADSGEVRIGESQINGLSDSARAALRRDKLGLVFQQFNLVSSLNVSDNLALHARLAGRHDAIWQAELARRLGLTDLLYRFPDELSGGQQQRVAFGRALAIKPLLLLADEPTGNLDEAAADQLVALALDLIAETGCGFLMVTHSARLAARLDRQLHLSAGRIA